MRVTLALLTSGLIVGCLTLVAGALTRDDTKGVPASAITWKKIVIDTKFRSEGVAIADVNNDGKKDLIVGDFWYEAPDWKPHVLRTSKAPDGYDPQRYSDCMLCFAGDFNGDGWQDALVIGFPGQPAMWYENPKDPAKPWIEHPVWRSACNESPIFVDLFGDGKLVLVMGIQPEGQMCWFAPSGDGSKPWEPHPISGEKSPGTQPFSHGLGMGDVNKDGRMDIICKDGWWEQPPEGRAATKPWTWHPAPLGEDCSNMFAQDLDGDGLPDVISASAHKRGIWWHKQLASKDKPGEQFQKFDIFGDVTQTHAVCQADINSDGKLDLITGKRWWAHGPRGDVDPNGKAALYWFEIVPGGTPTFIAHLIDDDSGVGTQFSVGDVDGDGLLDVAIANKKGVFLLLQQRK